MIAQLGVVLYMFVVGLELNANKLKDQMHAAVAISHVSIIAPFLLGAILALWLHPIYAPAGVSFTSFSLFLGVAMAITAFPVLARILTDREMDGTKLGTVAMACAAADDATAWCLLALVVGIVQTDVTDALRVAGFSLVFIAGMFLVVRPLLHSWCKRLDQQRGPLPQYILILGLVGVLLSALATEVIGIHAIFGAFLAGAMIPHGSRLANELSVRLRDSVTILLLPAFFAFTGMRTQIGLVSGWENWLACGLIIFVATLGKFGGTVAAARFAGISWRDSAALGTLMNTRGLMELIVLNIGLDLGVISPTLFAMMVLMALATTMATSPVLSLLIKETELDNDELTRRKLGKEPVVV
jgi:Kef-type K+ transport system membrane component KefB